jgi:serine/threonine-protein kinase
MGLYKAVAHSDPSASSPAPSTPASVEPPTQSSTSSILPVTIDDIPPRVAKLAIFPSDASVEVDGVVAPVQQGAVEISGALGSIHRVRLIKAGRERTADVRVTEAGAMPPKLELGASKATVANTVGVKPAAGTPDGANRAPPRPSGTASDPFDPRRLEIE